ncbi:MAG: cadherin domain-containing protein, partial [Bacteroidota bacterium]
LTNDGSVQGSMNLTLSNAVFTNAGATLDPGTHFTISNLPAGFTPSISVSADGKSGMLSLNGSASTHETSDNVDNLVFDFDDAAFVDDVASNISAAVTGNSHLGIAFNLSPILPEVNYTLTESASVIDIDATNGLSDQADEGVTYGLAGGDDESTMTIDASSGIITFINPPNYESPQDADTDNTYEVNVEVRNGITSTVQAVTIDIRDAKEDVAYSLPVELQAFIPDLDDVTFDYGSNSEFGLDFDFSSTGDKLFILETLGRMTQYSLSSVYDLSSVSFDNVEVDLGDEDIAPEGAVFDPTGTRLFVLGSVDREVNQYQLNSAFDLSGGVNKEGPPLFIGQIEDEPEDIVFSRDGKKMLILGTSSNSIHSWDLTVPFDITQQVEVSGSPFALSSDIPNPCGFIFDASGTKMLLIDDLQRVVYQYSLQQPYDLSGTVQYDGMVYNASAEDGATTALALDESQARLFIMGANQDRLHQYTMRDSVGINESLLDDGSVLGTIIITSTGSSFVNAGGFLDQGVHFSVEPLPAGLTSSISVSNDGRSGSFFFSGNATSSADDEDISNFIFTFADAAFVNESANNITDAVGAKSYLGLDFIDGVIFQSADSLGVDEGTSLALDVNASKGQTGVADVDISYSISSGVDADKFTIDTASGILSFVQVPDFEAPLDADTDNSYQLTITATDGGTSREQAVTITILSINDNAPTITSAEAITIPENSSVILKVSSQDADGDMEINYALIGGADVSLFSIDANKGELTFLQAPDFEDPGDLDANNDYVVQVSASDGVNGTNQTITITISDENDNSPAITSLSAINVQENSSAALTITATDLDQSSLVTFSLAGGADQALFTLETTTGVLMLNVFPDFENPVDVNVDNTYLVEVSATDGQNTVTQTMSFSIENVNEPPIAEDQLLTIEENSVRPTVVGVLEATDPEQERLSFKIVEGNELAAFDVEVDGTVRIFNGDALDFETSPSFTMRVEVEDRSRAATDFQLTIELTDVEEIPLSVLIDDQEVKTYPNPVRSYFRLQSHLSLDTYQGEDTPSEACLRNYTD